MQPRKKRETFNNPGHAHEITFSCYRRQKFLLHEPVRRIFRESLLEAQAKHEFDIWAYVLMPEHAHLMLYPRNEVYRMDLILSAIKRESGIDSIKWARAEMPELLPKFATPPGNKVKRRFWQDGPGYDRNCFSPKAIWKFIDYIHMNPVEKGLVSDPLDWPWSSARNYHGIEPAKMDIQICPVSRP